MTKTGASSSLGPPDGLPFFAHCESKKRAAKSKRNGIRFNSDILMQINNIFFGITCERIVNLFCNAYGYDAYFNISTFQQFFTTRF